MSQREELSDQQWSLIGWLFGTSSRPNTRLFVPEDR